MPIIGVQKDVDSLYGLAIEPGTAPGMIVQACSMLRKAARADLNLPNKDRALPLPTVVAAACDRYNDPADTVARTVWTEVLLPMLAALEDCARARITG
jgi:hypothetical protein